MMRKICALIMLAVLCLPGAAQAYYFEVLALGSTTTSVGPDTLTDDTHGDQLDLTVNAVNSGAALSGMVTAQIMLHADPGESAAVWTTLTDTSFYNGFPAGPMNVDSTFDLSIRDGEAWDSILDGSYSQTAAPGTALGQSASDVEYHDVMLISGIPYLLTFTYSNDFAGIYQTASREISIDVNQAPTPIPGAAWLLGTGLVGLVGLRKRFFA